MLRSSSGNQKTVGILAVFFILISPFGFVYKAAAAPGDCKEWVAKAVSVQGIVQGRKPEQTTWVNVHLNDTFCPGDMIRVGERSRAAIYLSNDSLIRLDERTAITFTGFDKDDTFFLEMISGIVHFFSRKPRSLNVATPFVNGVVEGTEFLVAVYPNRALISVLEGRVAAENTSGRLIVDSGHEAVAESGKAPAAKIFVRPRDAVHWALYYPPVIAYRPDDFPGGSPGDWLDAVRRSIGAYWEGDISKAFSSLADAPEGRVSDARFFVYRAALLLSVGRVLDAESDIRKALKIDPNDANARALESIVAVTQNEKDKALDSAKGAVELNPKSSAARVALSYAQQARFNLEGALESLEDSVKLDPQNALALARLAEVWLSLGYLDEALRVSQRAVEMNPRLARTQTVLGFAYLAQIKLSDSIGAFEKAIQMDQADPLPRLGLGLAKIRRGDVKEGRVEIEIATSLDPNNSLIRSYLGKAYFEEKRDKLAANQLAAAKELDPLDPTPYFYDAIRKQTENRPVEALEDLQKSIELNDNRAVYRSRLLLDEDLAARSASLGRIYRNLGFEQLALVEGWKSVNTDPSNYSAHRFLADSYSTLPRHEIARVSELLQSQLLQPINITPIQPTLAEANLFILEGAGPGDPAFNEFNPLFNRNRLALQASGIIGENDTLGDELVQSGVWNRFSYSLGQFHYETDGFRENNDREQDLYNAFAQVSLTYKTSLQAEYRYNRTKNGDLPLRFDPDNYLSTLREDEYMRTTRFGFHHAFSPNSDLLGSFIYQNADFETGFNFDFLLPLFPLPPGQVNVDIRDVTDEDGYLAEIQHIFRTKSVRLVSGAGYFDADRKTKLIETDNVSLPFPPFSDSSTTVTPGESDLDHTNLYLYSLINYPENVTWTLGASADFFDGVDDKDQFNPKFGVMWNPVPDTLLRGTVFRTLQRSLISSQTLEPTQVAGFNQFFDDGEGTEVWTYGVAWNQTFTPNLQGGVELFRRDLEFPYVSSGLGERSQVLEADWEEKFARAYVYWTPHRWLALAGEYQYEWFERDPEFVGQEELLDVKTHIFSPIIRFFHPSGIYAGIRPSYVDQKGEFGDPEAGTEAGDDQFWVVNATLGYRLPKRYGFLTFEVRNLFDKEFRFQETDPVNPRIYPERLLLGKVTLAF